MKHRPAWLTMHCLTAALLWALGGAAILAQQKAQPQPVRVPDEQAINGGISEMLAGWQIGDLELMHKYYADDVTVVSGNWEPPIAGWANFAKAYQQQRQRMEQVYIERRNTFVNVKGNLAYAAYQWEFAAMVDGQATSYRGQTTLVLERRGNRWLIIHNHTSIVPGVQAPQPASPAEPKKPGA